MTKKRVSIVTPFYNEELTIPLYFAELTKLFMRLPAYEFEVVCVNDGSKDSTNALLLDLTEKDERYRLLELSRNFGKEAALSAGIDHALGDAVIPFDADLQDPPEMIIEMLSEWEAGAEVVLAKRLDRSSDSFLKRKSAEFFYRIHNAFSSIRIPDNVGDFRLMDRIVVDALRQLREQNRFMKGLFAWLGFRTVTLEYVRQIRVGGHTKFSGWKLWNLALEGITSFGSAPLKFWTYIGLFGTVCSLMYAFFIIFRTLIFGIVLPGYASLLVVVLFFGSIQLISIGMLGEYIGRIYVESKGRPIYIIRKQYGKSS
jgi:glycosyltransferase involved in cell wall biosynthesis